MSINTGSNPVTYVFIKKMPKRLLQGEEQKEVSEYKFSAGFKQQFPQELEEISEIELRKKSMKTIEELKYYPIIIKMVTYSKF